MPATGAFTGAVPRINEDHRNTFALGLVEDKPLQLVERPRAEKIALTLSKPYPVPNPLEIFKDDSGVGAFSVGNNFLTDAVIDIAREAGLFFTTLLQKALGRFGAFLLKLSSELSVSSALVFDGAAGVGLPGACSRNIRYPEIDANKVLWLKLGRLGDIANLVEVKSPLAQDQIGFAPAVFENGKLPVTTDEGDLATTAKGPDADKFVFHSPRQNAAVVSDRSSALNPRLVFLSTL